MPRKWRFAKLSEIEPNTDAPTNDNIISGAPSELISHLEYSSGSGEATSAPPASVENRHHPEIRQNHMIKAKVDNIDIEDEDYVLDADDMASFNDHIDNLFANQDAE
ncbi:hypothetical protein PIB30_047785 [Stylosanthes scabra]|uniref:Uncharacterized protein n=1 Tax=Stylosanthes scabra TaxID=79078 RepID=A0ABU6UG67_9FABA|nr:hypothetical protein [Stylosanthes scabra]